MNPVDPNMSPDEQREFERDLAAETRLEHGSVPADPILAADWRLKRELAAQQVPALPAALRERVLARTTRARRPARWLAAAALLAGVTALTLVLQPVHEPAPARSPAAVSADQFDQFRLALAVLGNSGERGLRLAGEHISSSVAAVDLNPRALPYVDRLEHFLRPVIQSGPSETET
ncbi:MAG: hypothetical protein RQ729_06530 [Wenzhouxiangellaceae bacterium]|nr:hypothetical protein [Wenzhouxiangellaceae bacterium]